MGPELPATPTRLVSVRVTVAFASALPVNVPRVMVIAVPARIVPLKFESVMVAASASHQDTLLACAPPARTIVKLVPVRAPVPAVPILKIQTALALPCPLSVNVVSVNVTAARLQ